MIPYLRDPEAIYARSFEIIRAESDLSCIPESEREIALRVIHSCGMPDIASALLITSGFSQAARVALHSGRPILVDSEMLRQGIMSRRLPKNIDIICTLNDARVTAGVGKTTRSAAAVEYWLPHLSGAVVAIGNAPTALFALLEAIDSGAPKPAAVVAFPVGFVGAAESKNELIRDPRGIPYATLPGRRGGSAMAAAAINALAGDEA